MSHLFKLLAADGSTYESAERGTLGGYRPKKIYGQFDCWSAKAHLAKGGYSPHRVFFADEAAAIAAGYRPCGHCLRERYATWKGGGVTGTAAYPWLVGPG
jgi:hypothetical protein